LTTLPHLFTELVKYHKINFHNKYYSTQISNGKTTIALVGEKGSPRRCGGMGDILSGTIGVMHYWVLQHHKKNKNKIASASAGAEAEEGEEQGQEEDIEDEFQGIEPAMWACWGGSFITKVTASKAFSVHARSTTAPDLIDHLGEVFEEEFPSKKGHPRKMK
jgi:ATP-dependent NAD(P)H-hydrate dehydratase